MVLSLIQYLGVVAAFVVADWSRRRFEKKLWVLFFFVAVIAGNVAYLVIGFAWALANPDATMAIAHEIGGELPVAFGGTFVGAGVGLLSSLGDRIWKARKTS